MATRSAKETSVETNTARSPSRRAVSQRLESLQRAGLTHISKSSQPPVNAQTPKALHKPSEESLEVIAAEVGQRVPFAGEKL